MKRTNYLFGAILALLFLAVSCVKEDDETCLREPVIPPVTRIEALTLTLNKDVLELNTTEEETLIATVLPEDATERTVVWSSSHPEFATVDQTGKVTGVALGTTTITATCGVLSATCVVTVRPDIFVGGYQWGVRLSPPLARSWGLGTLWKNKSIAKEFWEGDYSTVSSIFVVGNDMYLGGSYGDQFAPYNNIKTKATVWKNNVDINPFSVDEPEMKSINSSIFVSGTDIYATGYYYAVNSGSGSDIARVARWKNGVRTLLTDGTYPAYGNTIFVDGADDYIGGYEDISNNHLGRIWKNGSPLYNLSGAVSINCNALYVSGGVVYAAGQQYSGPGTTNVAAIWKNNVKTDLSTGTGSASGLCMSVAGNDIYVGGSQWVGSITVAKLWKYDGSTVTEYVLSDGTASAECTAVYYFNGDIYSIVNTRTLIEVYKNTTLLYEIDRENVGQSATAIYVK